jgi:hypothetical protein
MSGLDKFTLDFFIEYRFHHLAPAYPRFYRDTDGSRHVARLGRVRVGIEVDPRMFAN